MQDILIFLFPFVRAISINGIEADAYISTAIQLAVVELDFFRVLKNTPLYFYLFKFVLFY